MFENKPLVEIIGIGCLILSLIFVGFEIRQSTNFARSEAFQQFHLASSAFFLESSTNETVILALEKRVSGTPLEELEFKELVAIRGLYRSTISMWATLYHSVDAGVLPENSLSAIGRDGFLSYPSFEEMWPSMRLGYDEDYVFFIENRIIELRNSNRE